MQSENNMTNIKCDVFICIMFYMRLYEKNRNSDLIKINTKK